jgi:ElaB/YqjD/DUF883 family membrane-anchored ribosome-binding protein
MTSTNQTFKQGSGAGRQATQAAKSLGEDVGDYASDLSRAAGEQFDRARDVAADAFDQTHAAVRRNPLMAVGIALGLGFLLGVIASSRH